MRDLSTAEMSAIIAMAWDDETSFDAIQAQTGLTETQVIAIMRREMKPKSFRLWRQRVSGRSTKHEAKRRRRLQSKE